MCTFSSFVSPFHSTLRPAFGSSALPLFPPRYSLCFSVWFTPLTPEPVWLHLAPRCLHNGHHQRSFATWRLACVSEELKAGEKWHGQVYAINNKNCVMILYSAFTGAQRQLHYSFRPYSHWWQVPKSPFHHHQNIHSHPYIETVWVKCPAQRRRLGWDGVCPETRTGYWTPKGI